jgi:copper chaperone
MTTPHQTFVVQGMTCGHCERAVMQAVQRVDPAAQVQIDRPSGKVDVQTVQPREQIAKAIADEGYAVQ